MGFALLAYNASAAAAGASNVDFTAANDADFSQRNGHYIFTESYRLHSALLVGASVTEGRFQVPRWNAFGEFKIFNPNRSASMPSNPQIDLWESSPPPVPINEEFQFQASNNLGAATEVENGAVILLTDDWNKNLPKGALPLVVKTTFTVTPTANAWSGVQNLTFSQSLRGGVYAVIGAQCTGANSVFFRIIFPRYKLYQGRKLRPGSFINNAVGNVTNLQLVPWCIGLGEWGRFHTFEPPTAEVFGVTAGATTYSLFMWLVYLGEDLSLLGYGATTI